MSDEEKKDQSEMSMEEILASIRKIIAEDQEGVAQAEGDADEDEDLEPAGFSSDLDEDFGDDDEDILDLSESEMEEEDDVLELAEDEVVPVPEEDPSPAPEPHHEESVVEDDAAPDEDSGPDISPPPMPEEDVERTYSSGPPVVEEEEAEAPEPEEEEMADEFKPGTHPADLDESPALGLGEGPDVGPAEDLAAARQGEDQDSILSPAAASATSAAFDELERSIARRQMPAEGDMVENLTRELIKPLLREWLDANLPRVVDEVVTREIKRIIGER